MGQHPIAKPRRHELRGALSLGEEPDPDAYSSGPNGLITDNYHSEYGYYYGSGGFGYHARLHDHMPDDDL